ncbi:hypothetical protein R1sor_021559 [Riccia sorocarpa]|uniref:Uncharacterized protein n=1 Tax=Riccia sorocarpa TaxID=122646 RepID=A0ABD3GHF3_9MARC
MVESQEDSIGPSPVLKQDEKHSWDLCVGRTDMVDARLCATRCLGPHFTRQAWHGDRFDQSRKLLMDIRDEERRREETNGGTEERMEVARNRVQHDHSEEAKQLFEEAITAQRRREHEEAERCRRRGKITWLKEGEAPTKYFFARLKAKHAQEEMAALEDASGRIIEDREEILEKVHQFYEELYAVEVESEEMVENRRTVVGRINRRLTAAQNQLLEELPSEKLITMQRS